MIDRPDPASPDPATRALLSACVFPEQAESSWNEFRRLRGERGPVRQAKLLPLAYRNLERLDPNSCAGLGEARAIYLLVKGRNEAALAVIEPALEAFNTEGIPFIVLKGAALAYHWYADAAIRPMGDWDVLVPEPRSEEAWSSLSRLGWSMYLPPPPQRLRRFVHAQLFVKGAVGTDLHSHSLWNNCFSASDDGFWARSRPFEIRGIPGHRLCAADQLLHVCVHALHYEARPSYLWIADALAVIGGQEPVDWNVLLEESRRRRVAPAMTRALAILRDEWRAEVPEEVVEALRATRLRKSERIAFEARQHPDFGQRVPPSLDPLWYRRWPEHLADYFLYLRFDLWRTVGSRPSSRDVLLYTELLAWQWGWWRPLRFLKYLTSLIARRLAEGLIRRFGP